MGHLIPAGKGFVVQDELKLSKDVGDILTDAAAKKDEKEAESATAAKEGKE